MHQHHGAAAARRIAQRVGVTLRSERLLPAKDARRREDLAPPRTQQLQRRGARGRIGSVDCPHQHEFEAHEQDISHHNAGGSPPGALRLTDVDEPGRRAEDHGKQAERDEFLQAGKHGHDASSARTSRPACRTHPPDPNYILQHFVKMPRNAAWENSRGGAVVEVPLVRSTLLRPAARSGVVLATAWAGRPSAPSSDSSAAAPSRHCFITPPFIFKRTLL